MSGWDHGSVGTLGGDVHVVQCDVEAGGIRRKGKPAARRGRKARGPTRSAELPNDRKRACSEHTRWRSPATAPIASSGSGAGSPAWGDSGSDALVVRCARPDG